MDSPSRLHLHEAQKPKPETIGNNRMEAILVIRALDPDSVTYKLKFHNAFKITTNPRLLPKNLENTLRPVTVKPSLQIRGRTIKTSTQIHP